MTMQGQDTLLATKLGYRARGSRTVERERLRRLLASAVDARLVLVSAPAGFGKTTLLADWIGRADLRSAWLTLDPLDNDIVRFSRYLSAATARLTGDAGGEPSFDGSQPFDLEIALAGILAPFSAALGVTADVGQAAAVGSRAGTSGGGAADAAAGVGARTLGAGAGTALSAAAAAAAGCSGGVVLVLDDYHAIQEPAIHRLVASLLERLPPGALLAIATRADPPLPLARLRARGELVEVRAEQLRFTASEAAELLRSAAVELALDEVDELTDRTEGWAAALRLAAVSLRGRDNHAELVRRFGASHRFVLDYVLEEVFAGLSPVTQGFLLRTSILERLSGPLCEAVTGEPDGQGRLEELDRANLLIIPLDDERRWYRYHALFGEILRARLELVHPGEITGLHARASDWHAARGDDDEAIAHALRSGDLARMARLVGEASGRRLGAGELATVRKWLDALPPDLVREDAQLSASYAWCLLLAGETRGVADRLADAQAALDAGRGGGPLARQGVATQIALLRSQLAGIEGDAATAVVEARRAIGLVPDGLPPVGVATLRGVASALLAVALNRSGDPGAAVTAYEDALPDLRVGGNVFALGRAIADLAALSIARGDPAQALRLCEAELARGPDEVAATTSGAVWAAMARARAELGQPDLADAAARRALQLATRAGDAPSARSAQVTLARVAPQLCDGLLAAGRADALPRRQAVDGALVEGLTDRELEVLRLVALGRSNSQVATELFVTVGTVKSHLHTISGKLGAANRVEAVARGRELGLLP